MDHPLIGRTLDRRYEVSAVLREVDGEVVFRAFDRLQDGTEDPSSMKVTWTTHDLFVEPALATVRGLRFAPATVNGRPVRVWVELPIVWAVAR